MLQENISYNRPNKKKSNESAEDELENFLSTKLDPGVSLGDLLSHIRGGNWSRFIVSNAYDIILSSGMHEQLTARTGIDREDSLLPGGTFRIDPKSGKINFKYNLSYDIEKVEGIREAAENKIKLFLKSNKVEFK